MTALFHSSHIFVCAALAFAVALVFVNRGQS
jgi:hypothetical protein